MKIWIGYHLFCWTVLLLSCDYVRAIDDLCSPRNIKKAMTKVCALHRRSIRLVNTNAGPPLQPHDFMGYIGYGDDIDGKLPGNDDVKLVYELKNKRHANNGEFRKNERKLDDDGFRRSKRSVGCPDDFPCDDKDDSEIIQSDKDLLDLISKQEFELSLRKGRSGSRELRDHSWVVKFLEEEHLRDMVKYLEEERLQGMVKYLEDLPYQDTPLHNVDSYLSESNFGRLYQAGIVNPWMIHGNVMENRIMPNINIHKYNSNSMPMIGIIKPKYFPTVVDNIGTETSILDDSPGTNDPSKNVWSSVVATPTVSQEARDFGYIRPLEEQPVLKLSKRMGFNGGHKSLHDVWMSCCMEGCTLEDWVSGCI